jgi:hypothetical protein
LKIFATRLQRDALVLLRSHARGSQMLEAFF